MKRATEFALLNVSKCGVRARASRLQSFLNNALAVVLVTDMQNC